MRWINLRREWPYWTEGKRNLSTLWLMEWPVSLLFERSCDILFFGIICPNSFIVCWCCRPIGYTSACFSCLIQSMVIGMP